MELCYQWQSQTQSHGARDPNYHWDVDGKKSLIYSQRKCLTRQLKLWVAYNPKVHCTIFRSTHNFLSERSSSHRSAGSRRNGASFCFRPVLFHTNLLSHRVMNVRCIHKTVQHRGIHRKFLARVELDTMLGPSRACMLKITPARYISLSGFHFDYSPRTQKSCIHSCRCLAVTKGRQFATLARPVDVTNYDTDLFLGAQRCHSSTHPKISSVR